MPHCNKKMLSFFLTTRCNLVCRYCYNIEERNAIIEQTISVDVAKSAVDWYFENNQSRHIRFYGPGEPSQAFEEMKAITEYAKNHPNGGDRVTVEIQTNGIWTKEIREWILDNVNIIWVSFDGMKDIQNYNRPLNPKYASLYSLPTCGDIIEDNVVWLNKNKGSRNLMVGARVTINSVNVSKQIEMVDYFKSLGIQYIWTDPILYSVKQKPVHEHFEDKSLEYRTEEYKNNFGFDMFAYLDDYVKAYYYAKEKDVFYGSFFSINFDGEACYHCRSCTPLEAPHITPDGYISACDMVVTGENPYHMSPFIVGKWNDKNKKFDIDEDRVSALLNRKSTIMSHCKDCPVKLHCGGYCLGETLNETGSLTGYNPLKCEMVLRLYDKIGLSELYPYLHP